MLQADRQTPVTAHRQAVDRPPFASRDGPVSRVDVTDQVPDEEVIPGVLLPLVALGPVDVPGVAAVGHDDDQVEPAGRAPRAEVGPVEVVARVAVEQVEDGIALVAGRLVVGRQDDVVGRLAAERRGVDRDGLRRRGGRRLGLGRARSQGQGCRDDQGEPGESAGDHRVSGPSGRGGAVGRRLRASSSPEVATNGPRPSTPRAPIRQAGLWAMANNDVPDLSWPANARRRSRAKAARKARGAGHGGRDR